MKLLTHMFTALRNAQSARKQLVQIKYSNYCWSILTVLLMHGYISGIQKKHNTIIIVLKYVNDQPAIKQLKQISKSSQRVYSAYNNLDETHNGLGLLLLSTSKGILPSSKAQELKVGGEILCKVF